MNNIYFINIIIGDTFLIYSFYISYTDLNIKKFDKKVNKLLLNKLNI